MTGNAFTPTPADDPLSEHRDTGTDGDGDADQRPQPSPFRFLGLGTELAAYTLASAAGGYVIDAARGHRSAYATAFGTLIGFALGMTRFIREVRMYDDK